MAKTPFPQNSPEERARLIRVGVASAVWLVAAPVAGHFLWEGIPWIMVLLLAAMAELLALTVWLLGSTLHDPVKRWELPPNPADTQRGWRGALANARQTAQGAGSFLREKVLRRPAKA
jgi:hypothetical protein